jgi:hypothetical protein
LVIYGVATRTNARELLFELDGGREGAGSVSRQFLGYRRLRLVRRESADGLADSRRMKRISLAESGKGGDREEAGSIYQLYNRTPERYYQVRRFAGTVPQGSDKRGRDRNDIELL